MADKLDALRRSENMRRIRSKNTKPEMLVRQIAFKLGYRFRLHRTDLPGKPDLVFPGRRKAIFVHGCFWHQHKLCREGRLPASRLDYWEAKLNRNVQRDTESRAKLASLGWQTLVIWECEVTDTVKLANVISGFLS